MKYISTRNSSLRISGSEAILAGISTEGGLFVPESFPQLSYDDILMLSGKSYTERAAHIMQLYLDEFSYEELLDIAVKAYSRFDGDPCPVVAIDDGAYVMELWHGPTCAFKDMALTILPQLISACRAKRGEQNKTLILVATSGDTGKAALEGFKDVDGTEIMVFYPNEGVSNMQRLQMITQEGENVYVAAIEGNFDDAQNAVKSIFTDKNVEELLNGRGYTLSSANSINWGRLLPQIIYYISAYCDLLNSKSIEYGEPLNFCVPCGNFGNILAGYYAKRMGLPINKLICASNINNVLTDFFATGEYDINRDFHKTISPSMDILISSNLERLLFEVTARDDKAVADMMAGLKKNGKYCVDIRLLNREFGFFEAGYADEDETIETIHNCFDEYDYLMDTHTAVAYGVYNNYVVTSGDETPTVVLSTASPYKFAADVYDAVSGSMLEDDFKAAKALHSLTSIEIPESIRYLDVMPQRFNDIWKKSVIKDKVLDHILNRGE